MKVFKETSIYTDEQKVSVFYEADSIILRLSEDKTPCFRMYLNKEEALELSIILKNYSDELKK